MRVHSDLLHMIGGYDPERGAAIVGHRGYYLTGPGLALNQALIAYGLSFLRKKEYKLVQTPYMMRKDVMAKVAQLSEFDEALYKVRNETRKPSPHSCTWRAFVGIPLMNLRHLSDWKRLEEYGVCLLLRLALP